MFTDGNTEHIFEHNFMPLSYNNGIKLSEVFEQFKSSSVPLAFGESGTGKTGDLEIKLTGNTIIARSPKKCDPLSDHLSSPAVFNQISQISTMRNFDLVNLKN